MDIFDSIAMNRKINFRIETTFGISWFIVSVILEKNF